MAIKTIGYLPTLLFENKETIPPKIFIRCDEQSVAPIMQWYGAFCGGDNYKVWFDGRPVEMDLNGCLVNPIV